MSTVPLRWLRQFLVGVLLVLSVVLFGDPEAFAAPTPAPVPSSGQSVADSWSCTDRTSPSPDPTSTATPPDTIPVKVGEDCVVTDWATEPSQAPLPDPLPVHEVSPEPASTAAAATTSLSCWPQDSSSTSPSPSASPSPSPSPSPGEPVSTGCAVSLDAAQWNPVVWIAASLLLIAVATFVLRYSRKIGRLVRS